MKRYFIYITTGESGTLYIGVTNNIERRIFEHKNKFVRGFTKKYGYKKLVYFEETNSIKAAILRKKTIKELAKRKEAKVDKQLKPWMARSIGTI